MNLHSLIIMLAAATAQAAPTECQEAPCIQVGSYNLELFGGQRSAYDGQERGPRSDQQLEAIVQRIAVQLDLEVVVFQEIDTTSGEWRLFKEKMAAYGYRFFEGTYSERRQFVVLAWDADEVRLLEPGRQLAVRDAFDFHEGCVDQGLRRPIAARFQAGEFDFWVVGVHLKSRRGAPACTSRIRREQCRDLVAAIDALTQGGERDVLLVGDFNERQHHDSLQPLADAGFTSQMRFLTPTSAQGSYVKNRELSESTDLIDQVWLRYRETREVVRNSAHVFKLDSKEAAQRYIVEQSDHVPVWASFRTDVDHD